MRSHAPLQLNIWTHLLGFAYFLWAIPRVAAAMEAGNATFMDRCYYWGFLGGAMVQMLTSTVYHIFRCMSEAWEAALLRLDLIGVVAMIGGAYAVALYNGFWCHPTWHGEATSCVFQVIRTVSLPCARGKLYGRQGAYFACMLCIVRY